MSINYDLWLTAAENGPNVVVTYGLKNVTAPKGWIVVEK